MLEAIFTAGINEIKVSGLTQWDRGQKITVNCPDITELYQVHFAFKGGTEALVVNAADTVFAIPDELLMQPRDLIAYVYAIASDGSGETVKTIHLPVVPRAKPEDYTSELTPSQMEQLEALLATIYEKNAIHIGEVEPDVGRVLWFNTGISATGAAMLRLNDNEEGSVVRAEVDGEEYGVGNTTVNSEPSASSYDFKVN